MLFAGLVTLVVLATSTGASARERKYKVHALEYATRAAPVFHKAYDITEKMWKGESNEMDINPHFKTLNRRPRNFHSSAAAENQVHLCFLMMHASTI